MDHKKIVIKRSTTGLGMFAAQDIPKDIRIIEYTGVRLTNEEAGKTYGRYIMHLNKKFSIDGKARTNLARYINHSCRPNAAAYSTGRRVWIWSKKLIKAGEEITMDYGKEYFNTYIEPLGCRCSHCQRSSKAK